MYTSYFANLKNVTNPLSISGKCPAWYSGPEYKVLAPKYGFFMDYKNGKINEEGYVVEYYSQVLDKLDPEKIYQHLVSKYGNDVTLLCYEKPGDFCHRRIVADWFETNLGIIVAELSNI